MSVSIPCGCVGRERRQQASVFLRECPTGRPPPGEPSTGSPIRQPAGP